jgi:hypothetical protein
VLGGSSFNVVPILKDGNFYNVKLTFQPEAERMSNLLIHPGDFNSGQRRKLGSTHNQMPKSLRSKYRAVPRSLF